MKCHLCSRTHLPHLQKGQVVVIPRYECLLSVRPAVGQLAVVPRLLLHLTDLAPEVFLAGDVPDKSLLL